MNLRTHFDMENTSTRRIVFTVAAIILATGTARVVAAKYLGLGYGESYHFSCALRPNLSYFDHPPLSLMMANIAMNLSGVADRLTLRLPFIVTFAGTTLLLFLVTRRLFGERAGLYAVVLLNLSAVFTVSTAMFLQSDGPLMFWWLTC